ncbi:MAG: hypothetical protein U9N51_00110 [Bacteroidota bacterium]|nr:hypothetical protein [Bacteroidota bacterium]
MKRNIFLIAALSTIFFFACNNDKPADSNNNKAEKEIILNNELVATETMTIIENSETNMEWDMISGSKIKIEGYTLDQTLKLLIGNSPARAIIEGEHHNPIMEINYEPIDIWESNEEENTQLVVDSLQKYFDFKLSKETRNMKVTRIISFDETLLIPRDDHSLGTSSKRTGKLVEYKNYTLQKLFKVLEEELNVIFFVEIEDNNKYDLKINVVNIDKVMQDLSDNYGFEFIIENQETEINLVSF